MTCPYICKNLPVVMAMCRKPRNVLILKDIPNICPNFLGFQDVHVYIMHEIVVNALGILI